MGKIAESKFLSADGIHKIHVVTWSPAQEPIGVIQIVEGMQENIERYDYFAKYLNEKGYLVVGHDHLGHGQSVQDPSEWGYFSKHGANDALEDIVQLVELTKEQYPGLPYCLLGHSMGSFYSRRFASEHGDLVDALILSGTGNNSLSQVIPAKVLVACIRLLKGERHPSKFLNELTFANALDHIKEPRTPVDWLTRDEKIVDLYMNNPANRFLFTVNGIKALLDTVQHAISFSVASRIRKDLPILLISGDEDPVGDYGKGVEKAFEMYRRAGIVDVKMHLFQGDRHEILNELDKHTVYSYICDWLSGRIYKESN